VDVLDQGIGKIFTDPDADKARAFFRKKNRKLESKLMTVKEAVEKFVKDGEYLTLGGFGANRIPAAVAHEIVRQGRKKYGFCRSYLNPRFPDSLCGGSVQQAGCRVHRRSGSARFVCQCQEIHGKR